MPYEDNPRDDVPFDKEDYEKWEKERACTSEQTDLRERLANAIEDLELPPMSSWQVKAIVDAVMPLLPQPAAPVDGARLPAIIAVEPCESHYDCGDCSRYLDYCVKLAEAASTDPVDESRSALHVALGNMLTILDGYVENYQLKLLDGDAEAVKLAREVWEQFKITAIS